MRRHLLFAFLLTFGLSPFAFIFVHSLSLQSQAMAAATQPATRPTTRATTQTILTEELLAAAMKEDGFRLVGSRIRIDKDGESVKIQVFRKEEPKSVSTIVATIRKGVVIDSSGDVVAK